MSKILTREEWQEASAIAAELLGYSAAKPEAALLELIGWLASTCDSLAQERDCAVGDLGRIRVLWANDAWTELGEELDDD